MSEEIGQKFGKWTVLKMELLPRKSGSSANYFLAQCECGVEKYIPVGQIRSGKRINGCYKCSRGVGRLTHGNAKAGRPTPEYRAWCSMKERCYRTKHVEYARYGGRGIKVCTEWLQNFDAFLLDMGKKPTPQHQIDRKDNNGDYTPENCKWSTRLEQQRNTSHSRIIEYKGEKLCLAEWAEKLEIEYRLLASRLNLGWTMDEAVSTPVVPGQKLMPFVERARDSEGRFI